MQTIQHALKKKPARIFKIEIRFTGDYFILVVEGFFQSTQFFHVLIQHVGNVFVNIFFI